MTNDRFEQKMQQLKFKHNQAEPTTSPQAIFQAVQQEKDKKKKKVFIPVLLTSIATLLIGFFLISGLIMNDEAEEEDPNQSGISGDEAEENEEDTTEPVDDPEEAEEEPTDEESEVDEEPETDEGTDPEEETNETDSLEGYPDSQSLTIYPEGMEETIQLNLHVSDRLDYASYVESNMILEEVTVGGKDIEMFYTDFAGTGEIGFKEAFIRVEIFEDSSLDEVEAHVSQLLEGRGFVYYEFNDEDIDLIDNADRHILFTTADYELSHYLTLVENEGDVYAIQTQMLVEMGDGSFPWIMEAFVRDMVFLD